MYDMEEKIDEIFKNVRGLWISSLFSEIDSQMADCDFSLKKDFFFKILRGWLEEGKIVFCNPNDPLAEVWKETPSHIIEYLIEKWPLNAKNSTDEDLNIYFYEIPALLWLCEDGSYAGS